MINIFHGDNQELSRNAYLSAQNQLSNCDILKIDNKSADENQISQFLRSLSFISDSKAICFSNFFSIAKPKLDKIIKIINSIPEAKILIWQDKTLSISQLKIFPKAVINHFRADNHLYLCLNQIEPHNISKFVTYFKIVINLGLYDLFLFLLKKNLRKKMLTDSQFKTDSIKQAYLNVIELDFQNKTGTLSIPKEIALERIMIKLLS